MRIVLVLIPLALLLVTGSLRLLSNGSVTLHLDKRVCQTCTCSVLALVLKWGLINTTTDVGVVLNCAQPFFASLQAVRTAHPAVESVNCRAFYSGTYTQ